VDYLRVPREVSFREVSSRDAVWSSSMFRRVVIPNVNVKRVKDLLHFSNPFEKGVEPGSIHYLRSSTHFFIRTKALQDHSYLLYPKGDAITPISPKVFDDPSLADGDILMSKDSNVGECAIVDGDRWRNHMFSGGIVRLYPAADRYYFFAFLKHPIFKIQFQPIARGATITHAKTLWLDYLIPFPSQNNSERVIRYVSALMQAIVEKEKAIRDKADLIHEVIQAELESKQKSRQFQYIFPSISDLSSLQRLDAVIYDQEYKSKILLVENYSHGSDTPLQAGFTVTPGPSLEIKIIRTRIDSETYRPNYYTLILPTNISVYGTMNVLPYLGTAKSLPLLKKGDIVFGEAGFQKGRSIVLIDHWTKCTTNAHGLYARRSDGDIQKAIFFRCIFNWYRTMRLIDIMAVGGSGGHFSPEYFDYVRIPKFPEDKQAAIARLYHHVAPPPPDSPTLDTFMDWHNRWNAKLGIWELDREMKALQCTLSKVQEQIIEGNTVKVPLNGA